MKSVRLAVDAESGDFGSQVVVSGVLLAFKETKIPFSVNLCGDHEQLSTILVKLAADYQSFCDLKIEHCADRIESMDIRARVWRTRMNSSIVKCITLQKEGLVDASISAGDTAILMGAAIFILGRAEGVTRPALAAFLPTIKRKPVLLLDVGANMECRTEHLVSFGFMGLDYVKRFLGNFEPRISLLNIGKESAKGTKTIGDTGKVFEKELAGYWGFIEGHEVLRGESDIVVCDGFVGNVLLKACESFYPLAESLFEDEIGLLQSLKQRMVALNPEMYGAVPLLGINGLVLKAHGGSSERAIANAVKTAVAAINKNSEQ